MSAGTTYGAWANKHLKMEKTKEEEKVIKKAAIECGNRWGDAFADLDEGQKWDPYMAGRKAFLEGFEYADQFRPAPSVKASEAAGERNGLPKEVISKVEETFTKAASPYMYDSLRAAAYFGYRLAGTQWGKEADQDELWEQFVEVLSERLSSEVVSHLPMEKLKSTFTLSKQMI